MQKSFYSFAALILSVLFFAPHLASAMDLGPVGPLNAEPKASPSSCQLALSVATESRPEMRRDPLYQLFRAADQFADALQADALLGNSGAVDGSNAHQAIRRMVTTPYGDLTRFFIPCFVFGTGIAALACTATYGASDLLAFLDILATLAASFGSSFYLNEHSPIDPRKTELLFDYLETRGIFVPREARRQWLTDVERATGTEPLLADSETRIVDRAEHLRTVVERLALHLEENHPARAQVLLSVLKLLPSTSRWNWIRAISERTWAEKTEANVVMAEQDFSRLWNSLQLDTLTGLTLKEVLDPDVNQRARRRTIIDIEQHPFTDITLHDTLTRMIFLYAKAEILSTGLHEFAHEVKKRGGTTTVQVTQWQFVEPNGPRAGWVRVEVEIAAQLGEQNITLRPWLEWATPHHTLSEILATAAFRQALEKALEKALSEHVPAQELLNSPAGAEMPVSSAEPMVNQDRALLGLTLKR